MVSIAHITDDARRYYEGSKRKIIDGIPCRVAAHVGATPGLAAIKAAVAGRAEIQPENNRCHEAPYFRFTPANTAPPYHGKPSSRGNVKCADARSIKSSWYRPASISLAPYSVHELTDTPRALRFAKLKWAKDGNPVPLREWLADTADERRAYWAAYDAARAAEQAADWRLAA